MKIFALFPLLVIFLFGCTGKSLKAERERNPAQEKPQCWFDIKAAKIADGFVILDIASYGVDLQQDDNLFRFFNNLTTIKKENGPFVIRPTSNPQYLCTSLDSRTVSGSTTMFRGDIAINLEDLALFIKRTNATSLENLYNEIHDNLKLGKLHKQEEILFQSVDGTPVVTNETITTPAFYVPKPTRRISSPFVNSENQVVRKVTAGFIDDSQSKVVAVTSGFCLEEIPPQCSYILIQFLGTPEKSPSQVKSQTKEIAKYFRLDSVPGWDMNSWE